MARAARVLIGQLELADEAGADLDAAMLWRALGKVVSRAAVNSAVRVVEQLVPEDDGSAEIALRGQLQAGVGHGGNVVAELTADHREVGELFDRIQGSGSGGVESAVVAVHVAGSDPDVSKGRLPAALCGLGTAAGGACPLRAHRPGQPWCPLEVVGAGCPGCGRALRAL
ncbi:hypothetical protein [Kitasatospora griseola]